MAKALWIPSETRVAQSAMTHFRHFIHEHTGQHLSNERALHDWSVADIAKFWRLYCDFASIPFSTPARTTVSADPMPYTRWFEGAKLNYAQALLNPPVDATQTAIIAVCEDGQRQEMSFIALRFEVARCEAALRRAGVEPGDRVAAFVRNTPEAVILLLACASMGAIFSSCSPDFGYEAALSRFGQIKPKLLVASDGYPYNGKVYATTEIIRQLQQALEPQETIVIPYQENSTSFTAWRDWLRDETVELSFTPLNFDHPLYILYSSGTTGVPKAMVHRAGGALLMHHKEQRLHNDIRPGDRVFYFSTCGWMMWNWLVSALAQGATIVLFDGSPSYPDLGTLWRMAETLELSYFGTSARFLHSCQAAGYSPKQHDLSALRSLASTGSPLSASGFHWVYEEVKEDLHLASISGGTDIVACFVGGYPTLPVYASQIQGPLLGVDLAVLNDQGQEVKNEPGELVCRQALPSMPLYFWNDPDFERYRQAYFQHYENIWRHGDLVERTAQGGIVIYGRSDATLNPGGVRIGTAEIYKPLEHLPEVIEGLAVGKREDGDEVIWLFVVLQDGVRLDEQLIKRIRSSIRENSSPRHQPKEVFQVSQLPRTRSGKATEIAVSKLVNGQEVPNREVMANPEALDEIQAIIQNVL